MEDGDVGLSLHHLDEKIDIRKVSGPGKGPLLPPYFDIG
jgi:hypothetical protein